MKSWDRFLLPIPFGRGLFVYGDPILVPRKATPSEQEEARVRLEAALEGASARAEREA